ncbi:MAG: endonuclease III, partial [Clostridia bacterium]|nr:endonuclease III [Clostridia bacterium]
MISKKTALKITEILTKEYPDSTPALKFSSPYELLIAVILSAQCTDERVNKVTETLFKRANTPFEMADLSQEELEQYIFSCGLYRSKAEHIISASKDIVEKFGGQVPSDLESLRSLAGVGRKTANV